jgi:hypothetical protein
MVNTCVKNNVSDSVNSVADGWSEALSDAQKGFHQAQHNLAKWRAAIRVIRERVAAGAPWPATQSKGHAE